MGTTRIRSLRDEAESLLVCRLLEEDNIPFVLRKMEDAAYDGIFTLQKGWGYIEAPEEHGERIREIVDAVREGRIRTEPDRSAAP